MRKTTAVASKVRPGHFVRSERDSHTRLSALVGPEFEEFTNPHLSARDTQEGKITTLRGCERIRFTSCLNMTIPPRSMATVRPIW